MAENEQAAFEQLYREHYWALLRYCLRRAGDEASARDVVAETFAIAWSRWARVPRDASLPWLYLTARNVLSNEHRRRKRTEQLTDRLRERVRADGSEASNAAARLDATWSAFAALSAADQEVLRLTAWEGLDGRDLAGALGCSASAAAVRLHRARRRLRQRVVDPRRGPDPASDGAAFRLSDRNTHPMKGSS